MKFRISTLSITQRKILFLFLVLNGLTGKCIYGKGQNDNRRPVKLSITLSVDYYSHFIDSVSLIKMKDTLTWSKGWEYNVENRTIGYHFNHLPRGNYVFFAKDILGLRHTLLFSLDRDTVIRLDDHMGFHPVPLISKEDMQKSGTVYIVYLLNGCFAAWQETGVLTRERNSDGYRFTRSSNYDSASYFKSGIGPVVFDDLLHLQTQSLAIKAQDSLSGLSTNRRDMIILSGDKLFHFSDGSSPFEWNLCKEFFNKYINQKFR